VTVLANLLAEIACAHAAPGGAAWFAAQRELAPALAAAGRKLGTAPIAEADAAAITAAGLRWPVTGADACGRAALVLREIESLPPEKHVALASHVLRRGEVGERQAMLRVLAALPQPARFVELAIDAAHRSNIESVFAALACDNDFVRELPEPAFNQLVLKALFIGAPLARIAGLAQRTTPELVRMVEAYASERRAAGRSVPADAELITRSP
jgi:hypothetical protein